MVGKGPGERFGKEVWKGGLGSVSRKRVWTVLLGRMLIEAEAKGRKKHKVSKVSAMGESRGNYEAWMEKADSLCNFLWLVTQSKVGNRE